MPVSRREFLALVASLPALGAGRLAPRASSVPVSEILARIAAIQRPDLRAVARASASRFLCVAAGTTAREAIADLDSLSESQVDQKRRVSALADIAVTSGNSAFLDEAAGIATTLSSRNEIERAMAVVAEAAAELRTRAAAECVLGWLRSTDPRQTTLFLPRVTALFRDSELRDEFVELARSACERVDDSFYLEQGLRALAELGERVSPTWPPITRARETVEKGDLEKDGTFRLCHAMSACCPEIALDRIRSPRADESAGRFAQLLAWAGAVRGLRDARAELAPEARRYWDRQFEAARRLRNGDDERMAVQSLIGALGACCKGEELASRVRRIVAWYFDDSHARPYFRTELMKALLEVVEASGDRALQREVAEAGLRSLESTIDTAASDVSFMLDVGAPLAALSADPGAAIQRLVRSSEKTGRKSGKRYWTDFYRIRCQIECGRMLIDSNRYEEGIALLHPGIEASFTELDFSEVVTEKSRLLPRLRPADRLSTFDGLLSEIERGAGLTKGDDLLLRRLVGHALQ